MFARFEQMRLRKADAAFTLVEVVVGAGLLGIMMIAFFTGLASGLAVINTARQDLRATQILTQKTEAVRLCKWDQLATLPTSFQDYYTSQSTTNGIYYGTISVTSPNPYISSAASYYSNIDLVTINLVWTNYLGAHAIVHNRQAQTMVSYYGLVNYIAGPNFVQQ